MVCSFPPLLFSQLKALFLHWLLTTSSHSRLFGKPGGLARVFVDGQQEQRNLDSSDLPNDGSALWTKSGLASGKTHSIKLQGFQSADLNLVIDFFG
jgi:hypothetical protein